MSRPIPDKLIERYHCAIYAIDTLGPKANGDRAYIRAAWQAMQVLCAMKNEDGDPKHEAECDRIIANMGDLCAQALRHERDSNRPLWQKQRDFLIGTMRRVRRATTLDDPSHLHYYDAVKEIFDADMKHEKFQVGYRMWQAIRAEIKDAISLTLFGSQTPHAAVQELHAALRRVVTALEFADVSGLSHYEVNKSPLHLSAEEEGRVLWEAVRTEIGRTVVLAEARVSA